MMEVKIKKLHKDAKIPEYAYYGDAGLDLTAVSKRLNERGCLEMGTGLAIEIPPGHMGLIFPRSSIADKRMALTNSVGVIDSSYRGEIIFKFKAASSGNGGYEIGDKIGQLVIMPYPRIALVEVDELSETVRGDSGFGSSDE